MKNFPNTMCAMKRVDIYRTCLSWNLFLHSSSYHPLLALLLHIWTALKFYIRYSSQASIDHGTKTPHWNQTMPAWFQSHVHMQIETSTQFHAVSGPGVLSRSLQGAREVSIVFNLVNTLVFRLRGWAVNMWGDWLAQLWWIFNEWTHYSSPSNILISAIVKSEF